MIGNTPLQYGKVCTEESYYDSIVTNKTITTTEPIMVTNLQSAQEVMLRYSKQLIDSGAAKKQIVFTIVLNDRGTSPIRRVDVTHTSVREVSNPTKNIH